jgi:hypothetical protein
MLTANAQAQARHRQRRKEYIESLCSQLKQLESRIGYLSLKLTESTCVTPSTTLIGCSHTPLSHAEFLQGINSICTHEGEARRHAYREFVTLMESRGVKEKKQAV